MHILLRHLYCRVTETCLQVYWLTYIPWWHLHQKAPPGGTPLYGLNRDVRPDRVWFSKGFVLNGVSISSIFVLNWVSLHDLVYSLIYRTSPQAEFISVCQCPAYWNKKQSILTVKRVWCWVKCPRQGKKNLNSVLNRVAKSEIFVLNRVRV